MKRTINLILFGFFILQSIYSQNLYSDLFDGSSGITNGYGTWGPNNYIREASIDVPDKGIITFYHPDMAAVQMGTIFFISGWGQQYESYDKLFKYIASLGYPVVNIYNYNPGSIHNSYQNSLDMMQQAVTTYPDWIDTSKIGLMGHSYGAGSTIWLGQQVFDTNGLNWGTNGRFILMMSPWLSFLVESTDLQNYPSDVKLLILQSYDDFYSGGPNYNTDPRALRAVYELINIPDSEKDFITIFSDNNPDHEYEYNGNTYSYEANHYISYTDFTNGVNNPFDALDVYASNRLTHALIDYVFEGNISGKEVALGNGSTLQKDMGILPDLSVTDYYITNRPESVFEYKCSETAEGTWGAPDIWKLSNYCNDIDENGIIDNLSYRDYASLNFSIFPIPSKQSIQIRAEDSNQPIIQVIINDITGRELINIEYPTTIDISSLKSGTYIIIIKSNQGYGLKKIIIE